MRINLAKEIERVANGENIEAITLRGPVGFRIPRKFHIPESKENTLLNWQEAKLYLDIEINEYSDDRLPYFTAWTSNRVIFLVYSEAFVYVRSLPRNPITDPNYEAKKKETKKEMQRLNRVNKSMLKKRHDPPPVSISEMLSQLSDDNG